MFLSDLPEELSWFRFQFLHLIAQVGYFSFKTREKEQTNKVNSDINVEMHKLFCGRCFSRRYSLWYDLVNTQECDNEKIIEAFLST